jgi:DNA-binding transcriptional LysR family regulator
MAVPTIRGVSELRRLRYFLAVAQERNFTRAAELLHVAQPSLSRQVRLLERELGAKLLRRTTREVELTPAGRLLYERGAGVVTAMDDLAREVARLGTGAAGELALAYTASAGYETAPRLVAALRERHPDLRVTTTVLGLDALLEAVRRGRKAAGLARCAPPRDGLDVRPLRDEPLGVLVRRDHPLGARERASLADLRDEALLMHARAANPGHYDAIVGLCRAAGVEPRLLERPVTFDPAQTPVIAGQAVSIVGESTRAGLAGELAWVPLDPPASISVDLVTRAGEDTPVVRRLRAVADALGRELGWRAE